MCKQKQNLLTEEISIGKFKSKFMKNPEKSLFYSLKDKFICLRSFTFKYLNFVTKYENFPLSKYPFLF